ncbi:MAG TPA: 4a-hydroxytetrahydrobiopterin dehydratase [Chitinophagaceae bacterium]|nr:4a-hydroxytetrahydrobiopterin dehydratase [Chitinophagaceae bacterium]
MKINFTPENIFFPKAKNAAISSSEYGKKWKEKDNALYRKFQFKNFSEAFAFMTRVALEAEKMDHHPRWTNVYNTVEVWLNTHSAGDKITKKDKDLAKLIGGLL